MLAGVSQWFKQERRRGKAVAQKRAVESAHDHVSFSSHSVGIALLARRACAGRRCAAVWRVNATGGLCPWVCAVSWPGALELTLAASTFLGDYFRPRNPGRQSSGPRPTQSTRAGARAAIRASRSTLLHCLSRIQPAGCGNGSLSIPK